MPKNILILGGNRFVGHLLVQRLVARGEKVVVLNRGSFPDALGDRVVYLKGDRTRDLARLVGRHEFDAVVDFTCFTGADAEASVEVFGNRVGHYVMISTGQVYLVREGSHVTDAALPASREEDYVGPVMPAPPSPADQRDWEYGVWKRDAEDVLAAHSELPSTRIRIPMVNGPRDYYRRIESYLHRIVDGRGVLVPTPHRVCRHVYGLDVAVMIERMLGARHAMGKAFNLAQPETPTLLQLLHELADLLGARLRWKQVSAEQLTRAGLTAKQVSPFSDPWMSLIDPTRALKDLGWRSTPLSQQLATIVEDFLSHPRADKPASYATREREIGLLGD